MFITRIREDETEKKYCIWNVDSCEEMAAILVGQANLPKHARPTIFGHKKALTLFLDDGNGTRYTIEK